MAGHQRRRSAELVLGIGQRFEVHEELEVPAERLEARRELSSRRYLAMASEIAHKLVKTDRYALIALEACRLAGDEGIVANHLHIKWIVPFHVDEVTRILGRAKRVIIVENNQSGQFARYLRSETGFNAHGHIRKYDGEPFMPHHIVNAVKEQLEGKAQLSVPAHEILV